MILMRSSSLKTIYILLPLLHLLPHRHYLLFLFYQMFLRLLNKLLKNLYLLHLALLTTVETVIQQLQMSPNLLGVRSVKALAKTLTGKGIMSLVMNHRQLSTLVRM